MSEYQYYEFQAVDRPLTEEEMRVLRDCSSRATITPTCFVNEYNWGDLKADPSRWMEKYFDGYMHVANWGTRELTLRLPRHVLPLDLARRYLQDDWYLAHANADHVFLGFLVEDEDTDWRDGHDCLASFLPLRADIAAGDLRTLYLGWLRSVQHLDPTDVADGLLEPRVPAGLGDLTASLRALIDFLGVDEDLVAIAATESPPLREDPDVGRWIERMPESDKTELLRRIAAGSESFPRAELLRRYRSTLEQEQGRTEPRAVTELLTAAMARREKRRKTEAERVAREHVRRECEAAAARERYLDRLAEREVTAWNDLERLVATKQPRKYDVAVNLLSDLRDLAARESRSAEFSAQLRRLTERHARKLTFVRRMRDAGLSHPDVPLLALASPTPVPEDRA